MAGMESAIVNLCTQILQNTQKSLLGQQDILESLSKQTVTRPSPQTLAPAPPTKPIGRHRAATSMRGLPPFLGAPVTEAVVSSRHASTQTISIRDQENAAAALIQANFRKKAATTHRRLKCQPLSIERLFPVSAPPPAQSSVPSSPPPKGLKKIQRRLLPDGLATLFYPDTLPRQLLHTLYISFMAWDLILITLYIMESTFIPTYFFIWSMLVYGLESCLAFNTAVTAGWEVHENVSQLQRSYWHGWFRFDILLAIPWTLVERFSHIQSAPLYTVLLTIRALRLVRVHQLFPSRSPLIQPPLWCTAVIWTFWAWLVVHVLGLAWMVFADKTTEQSLPMEATVAQMYLSSCEWALSTLLTGPSATATGWVTKLYQLFVLVLGVTISTIFQSLVIDFFVNPDPYQMELRERRNRLSALLTQVQVPWSLHKSVLTVCSLLLNRSPRNYDDILELLPQFLSEDFRNCIKQNLLSEVPMFRGLSQPCIKALAVVLQNEFLPETHHVVKFGDEASCMYFIANGMVAVKVVKHGSD
eukprot:NODE_417_length_1723_cov_90.057945_g303_i0.p1 GENE.NODE_417_length_1723_cov_90.057945_g303_i0~~NODE_417_length_1723_cov_90.057945_g303_i0.p1  ORF type:complete len:529 (-),score=82.47 NODE_417_length_1723_cov_90.057945_g303_i0:72-1658(-)